MTETTYKKTDRIRTTKQHVALMEVVDRIRPILDNVVGTEVDINVTRSQEQKYARALFDVEFGDTVIFRGLTAEQITDIITGIRVVNQLKMNHEYVEEIEMSEAA